MRHAASVKTLARGLQKYSGNNPSLRAAYERVLHDSERYRSNRDGFCATGSVLLPWWRAPLLGPVNNLACDHYAEYEIDTDRPWAHEPCDDATRVVDRDVRLAMSRLTEVAAETLSHLGTVLRIITNEGTARH